MTTTSAKHDPVSTVRKDSISKHSSQKPDFFKNHKSEIPASRKEHKHSVESDHTLNHVDSLDPHREKSSGVDYLKHSNKDRDHREDHKEHKSKFEKEASFHKSESKEKHKDKSNEGFSLLSNHGSKDKDKSEQRMEKNLFKEKEKKKREKEKQREKDQKESSGSKDKSKELTRHKTKMQERPEKRSQEGKEKDKERSRDKDKDRAFEKDKERRKDKYKERKQREFSDEDLREMLLSIPDPDEPYYFSMYDKVKARSQNNQKNHTPNSSEGKSSKSNKFGKRKGKSQIDSSGDDSDDDDDDSSDSDADDESQKQKKKLGKLNQRPKYSSVWSDDEEEPQKKKHKKANVDETDSEEDNSKPTKEDGRPHTYKYAKKLLDFTDSSSGNDEKRAAGSSSKKKNKMMKRDKERPNDIGSPVKEKVDRHDMHEKLIKEKEKELLKIKKNKAERKEKEREMEAKREVKVEKEKEKRPRSEDEDQNSKMIRLAKRKKKKIKEKQLSKEKRLLGFTKEDGKSRSSELSRRSLLSSDDEMSLSSDSEESQMSSVKRAAFGHKTIFSDIDNDMRSHSVIKSYSNEKDLKTNTHHHNDNKDLLVSKEHCAKEKDIKVNNLSERHFATKPEKTSEKIIEKEKRVGDRSPTKKDAFFSSKIHKHVFLNSENDNDSTAKELTRKKKKSIKNKDREKSRKDSESSDSKKSDKKDKDHHRPTVLDSSSNEGEIISISPTRSSQPSQPPPKTDFKSLLLPDMSVGTSVMKATTPPKTPEAMSSSRSSSYTEDLGLVHRDRDDGSSSDSRLDEELINDARKLEECMMAKNDDSYDSNLSGSSSPLNSTSKTLRQTDLSLLPQLVPSFSVDCSNIDANNMKNFFTAASQRCFDEEAAIQSLKLQKELQKELESKDSEHHHHHIKPTAFESMPPFPPFSSNMDNIKPIIDEPAAAFTEIVAKMPSEDPTLFIPAEVESCTIKASIASQEEPVKCPDFSELESQRNIEDDLAVAALLQDMEEPCHLPESGTHDRSSIDQTHSEEIVPNYLNIFSSCSSSDGDRTESLLTTPSTQAIVLSNPTVPPIIGPPDILVDDHELNAAVHEIELSCPQPEHKGLPVKETTELMFNDEDDDEPSLTIVDENLEKSLLDDSDLKPPSQTEIKKPLVSSIGMTPTFGSMKPFGFEPSICNLPKPSTASIADIIKDSIKDSIKENAKLVDPLKIVELAKSEELVKPFERNEKRTIDLHMSMPILTSAFDTKIQSETVSIKERTRSTDSDKSEPMKSPFANFLSPRSVHSDTSLPEKKSTLPVTTNELSFTDVLSAQLAEDKRDSCSESVVSDKTEIEEESVSELLPSNETKATATTATIEEILPTIFSEAKSTSSKLVSEESEPECESAPPKSKRGRKPKNRKLSDTSLHSPRSDAGLETHGQMMTSLSINTSNLTCSSGNLLLSPTSNSNASSTTTTSDISPGSQAKRSTKQLLQQQQQLQQQHQLNYGIRRSVRSAAVAATMANSNSALDLDDTDLSLDEPPPPLTNKDEPTVEEEQGGVKKSKRGRKKKCPGNVVEHVKIIEEDKSKKDKQLHVLNSTSNESRPTKPDNLYDVFEFRESDEDEPLHLTSSHFLASEEKRHSDPPPPPTVQQQPHQQLQQQQQQTSFESCISPNKIATETSASAPAVQPTIDSSSSANSVILGDNTNAVTGKEYVSEMNQHGKHGGMKMIIRLKDGQEDLTGAFEPTAPKSAKNLSIEDGKSNDGMSNSSTAGAVLSDSTNSIKGVRKSARLMSQVPKTTIEDTIEDVIKTKAEEKANASKRITRSYRKSDDTNSAQASGEISEESDGKEQSFVLQCQLKLIFMFFCRS